MKALTPSRFDWVISLSLSNFLFWRDWLNVLTNTDEGGTEALYLGLRQSLTGYLALPAYVMALTILIWLGVRALRSLPFPRPARLFGKIGATLLALVAPFVLFTFSWSIFLAFQPKGETLAVPSTRNPSLHRTLVLLFDEMDETIFFREREAGFSLPHLDEFRKQAFLGTKAFSPNGCTLLAIPTLLTGHLTTEANATSASELKVQADGKTSSFSEMPQIFSQAKASGARTGILGFFHPYCRLFGRYTHRCRSFSSLEYDYGEFPFVPLTFQPPWTAREILTHRRNFALFAEAATAMVADPSYDLIYFHVPLPRPPGISAGKAGYGQDGFLANGALADKLFGELRRQLERAGMWEQTQILITADHGYRDSPRALELSEGRSRYLRVPFLVKFAGKVDAASFDLPFSTGALSSWVDGLLNGELKNAAALEARLKLSPAPLGEPARSQNEYCKLPRPTP